MQTLLEVFFRPTTRTVSRSMAEICQSGLSGKLIMEYTPACSLSRLQAVSNSAAETTCVCSTQSWWHHPQRCNGPVTRKTTTALLTCCYRLSADRRWFATRQSLLSSLGRRTGAAHMRAGARSLRTSLASPCRTRTRRSSRPWK